MKSFFEEFGFVILAAVVVLLLVGMTTPIGSKVEGSLSSIVENMTTQANGKVSDVFKTGE